MMRRSLPQLLRTRGSVTTADGVAKTSTTPCCVNVNSSSTSFCQRQRQRAHDVIIYPPSITSRPLHSTSTVRVARDEYYPPRRDIVRKNNGRRGRVNERHRRRGQGRGTGRHDNNAHNRFGNKHGGAGDSQFAPGYISHLEQRAKDHIQKFPAHTLSKSNAYDDVATLLAPWSTPATELIMLISKQWGRHSNHKFDREGVHKAVLLANDLLIKLLECKQHEVDKILEESKWDDWDGSLPLSDPPMNGLDEKNEKNTTAAERPSSKRKVWEERKHLNTEILCQTVVLGWSRCDPKTAPDAARHAQSILDKLEYICSQREKISRNKKDSQPGGVSFTVEPGGVSFSVEDVTPSIRFYNHVLSCWSRSTDPEAEIKAKKLFEYMILSEDDSKTPGDGCAYSRPETFSYNNMLNLYANRGDAAAAENLLKEMEQPDHAVNPDVYSYSITMNAIQKRFTNSRPNERDMKDPQRAEELLSRLIKRYEKSNFQNDNLRPSNVTFGTIISMYAQADRVLREDSSQLGLKTRHSKARTMAINNALGKKDVGWGAANAERVLDWMIAASDRERRKISKQFIHSGEDRIMDERMSGIANHNDIIRPSTFNFATVMDAWAKAGKGVEGARNCERLLDRLVSLHEKLGYAELRPNPLSFGTVIDAWAKADEERESAEHAESFLDRIEELFLHRKSSNPKEMLSNIPYNLVIDAWSRRSGKDISERAEKVLRRLVSSYEQTSNTFLRPDVISYTNVIKASVNDPNGGKIALKLLQEMNEQYRDGNTRAKPDTQALAVILDACARNGMAMEAEKILFNEVDDTKKNEVLFNTIMTGYKHEGRAKEAEVLLRRMIQLENAGHRQCAPDMISYSVCVDAWGNTTSPDRVSRAMALLDESIKRYRNGDENCKPSNATINIMANIITNSDESDRETQVLALFQSMEDIGFKPDLVSFNILIKACASAKGDEERKRQALVIAASAFNSLSPAGIKADSATYTSMVNCMVNLMEDSPERTTGISGIFEQCCSDGCLNQHILNILKENMPVSFWLSITEVSSSEGTPKVTNLPTEWSHRSSTSYS